VDAHQKWCGPCTAITGMLKRIKNELGDDLLKFATVRFLHRQKLKYLSPPNLWFGTGVGKLLCMVDQFQPGIILKTGPQ